MAEGKRKIRVRVSEGAAGGLGSRVVWLRPMQGRAVRQIMKPHRPSTCPPPAIADRIPVFVLTWMQPFRACFTAPIWEHVLVLVLGAVLAPGKRTVTAALRVRVLRALFAQDQGGRRTRKGDLATRHPICKQILSDSRSIPGGET